MSKEDNLQKAVIRYLRLQYPDKLFFHVPNGGKRNLLEAAKFKAMGVLPGVSDILIMEPNNYYGGLCIELKVDKNKPTLSQMSFLKKAEQRGWLTAVCYTLNDAMDKIDSYFALSREDKGELITVNLN